jgi:hypothetical protein
MTQLTDDEFWNRIFHPVDAAKVRAGIRLAQEQRDAQILAELDKQLAELECSVTGCDVDAVTMQACRHTGRVIRFLCARHREALLGAYRGVDDGACPRCNARGRSHEIFRFVAIFAVRSRP